MPEGPPNGFWNVLERREETHGTPTGGERKAATMTYEEGNLILHGLHAGSQGAVFFFRQ